jgi:glutathione synthase/RimK-type ligase-like ATP-grasp enzyme
VVAIIVASDLDLTVDAVLAECDGQGVEVVRFDLSDYPVELRFALDDFTGSRALRVRERVVDLAAVDAVWYRRPSNIVGPADGDWGPAEAATTLAGTLYSTDCLWMNRPDRDLAAGFKVHQLHLARSLGLRTPRTLLTNDPATLRGVAERNRPLVYKLLHGALVQPGGGRWATVLTTPVADEHLERADQIRHSPGLFQEYVAKACEVRMTVVGPHVFPVTIDSQSQARTETDWRAAGWDSPPYGDFRPVPDHVLTAVQAMMRHLGIVYGAFDFIVDEAGEWVFLEVNPMGQYHWIEQDLGVPISAAIASLLGAGAAGLDEPVRVVGY